MQTIKVLVDIPLAAAVSAGRAQYGQTAIELSEQDLAAFSAEQRLELVHVVDLAHRLTVDVADAAHVVGALDRRITDRKAAEARLDADREARIVAAVAAPDQAWLATIGSEYFDAGARYEHKPIGVHWPYTVRDITGEPRLVARAKDVEARMPDLQAAWQAKFDAYQERKGAEQREAEAKRATYAAALRAEAAKYPELARAAAENYRVENAVLDNLATNLVARVSGPSGTPGAPVCIEAAVDTHAWSKVADRAAPTAEAFGLLDRVRLAVDAEHAQFEAAIGRWTVSRIVHVDVCPHKGRSHYVTAILATLSTPEDDAARQVTFSLESLACDHDAEEA